MAELVVHALDDIIIGDSQDEKINKFFFKDVHPLETVHRNLFILNNTTVSVKFHWSLFKENKKNQQFTIDDQEDYCFEIEPS